MSEQACRAARDLPRLTNGPRLGCRAGEVEDVLQDRLAAIRLFLDDLSVLGELAARPVRQLVGEARAHRLRAARDRRERVVDLVGDAGREASDRRHLLRLGHRALDETLFRHVVPDRDDVGDRLVRVEAHRHLLDAEDTGRVTASALDLVDPRAARVEDLLVLAAQRIVPPDDVEEIGVQRLPPGAAKGALLAAPVPHDDAEVAVDRVQGERQRVDHRLEQAALLLAGRAV